MAVVKGRPATPNLPAPSQRYDPVNEAQFRRQLELLFEQEVVAPRLVSVDLTFDESDDKLYLRAVGGQGMQSALFEIDDDPDFGSPKLSITVALVEGNTSVQSTVALIAIERGMQWYGRVTPYSGANGSGIVGTPLRDSVFVPLELDESIQLESATLVWVEGTTTLRNVSRGGANCASIKVEFDDDPAFGSISNTQHKTLTEGNSVTTDYAASASDRNKEWYVRVTPYDGPLSGGVVSGVPGNPHVASTRVEGNVGVPITFGHAFFHAWTSSGDPFVHQTGYLRPDDVSPSTTSMVAPLAALIPGMTITSFEMLGSRVSSTLDTLGIQIWSSVSGILSTMTHSTTGSATVTDDIADYVVVDGETFEAVLIMIADADPNDVNFNKLVVYVTTKANPGA